MFSLFSARSVLNEIYLQRCPSSVIATQFHYKSTYVLQISIQFCFVLWNLVDTFNRIQLLLYFMYKFTTKCEWVNCMHIIQWNNQILKTWNTIYTNIVIIVGLGKLIPNWELHELTKYKHTVVLMNITINNSFISFWTEKSTSLLILALYLLKEIANIGKKKLYMYLHEVPDTLYVSQVNILKLSWTKCPSKYNSVILSEHRHELF